MSLKKSAAAAINRAVKHSSIVYMEFCNHEIIMYCFLSVFDMKTVNIVCMFLWSSCIITLAL